MSSATPSDHDQDPDVEMALRIQRVIHDAPDRWQTKVARLVEPLSDATKADVFGVIVSTPGGIFLLDGGKAHMIALAQLLALEEGEAISTIASDALGVVFRDDAYRDDSYDWDKVKWLFEDHQLATRGDLTCQRAQLRGLTFVEFLVHRWNEAYSSYPWDEEEALTTVSNILDKIEAGGGTLSLDRPPPEGGDLLSWVARTHDSEKSRALLVGLLNKGVSYDMAVGDPALDPDTREIIQTHPAWRRTQLTTQLETGPSVKPRQRGM